MPQQDLGATIQRMFDEIVNAGRIEVTEEIVSPDFTSSTPQGVLDRDGFKEYVGTWRAGFPDITCTVYDLMVDGSRAAWRVRASGAHAGEFMGIPPTGRTVDFDSMNFATADSQGRPLDHTVMMDQATMMAQLGIAAPSAPAGSGGNAALIRSGYEAFGRKDIPAVLALFDSDIVWHTPDSIRTDPPLGGIFRGPDQVLQFFLRLTQIYTELRVEPEQFIEAGDHVVVQGHHRGTTPLGTSFEVPFAHIWTLRDGKALSFREHLDTALMSAALGLSLDEIIAELTRASR